MLPAHAVPGVDVQRSRNRVQVSAQNDVLEPAAVQLHDAVGQGVVEGLLKASPLVFAIRRGSVHIYNDDRAPHGRHRVQRHDDSTLRVDVPLLRVLPSEAQQVGWNGLRVQVIVLAVERRTARGALTDGRTAVVA
eukprot:scaffold298_cov247-Pinguiococcus_pyrenoidosus.AAC.6